MCVAQRSANHRSIRAFQSAERRERLHADLRICRRRGELAHDWGGVLRIAFHEDSLHSVALPAIRRIERVGERGVVELREIWHRVQLCSSRQHAVDAACVRSRAHVEPAHRFGCDPLGMFEREAVDVHNVERAVRAGLRHHWAKPYVEAREEFAVLLVVRATARETRAVGAQHFAMHDIVHGLACEDGVGKCRPEQFVAVGHRAVAARHVAERLWLIESDGRGSLRIRGEDARVVRVVREHLFRRLHGEARVPAEVAIVERVVPEPRRVVVAEPVSPVVAMPPELRAAALGLELSGVGAEADVAAGNAHTLLILARFLRGENRAAAVAVRTIEPAVEAPVEAVDAMLLIPLGESGEEHGARVGLAAAAPVFEKKNVRRGCDDHAVAPRENSSWVGDVLGKNRRRVVVPVAVRIGEHLDSAAGFALAVHAERVVAHLHDPQPPARVPLE